MEEELKESLFRKRRNGWTEVTDNEKENIFQLSEKYMKFLNKAKTEREFIKEARKFGFEFKKIKKEPCLVNLQENTKKIFPLSVIASLFANLFVDESCILQTMEKFNQLKCENGERLDIFFNNLANFKS